MQDKPFEGLIAAPVRPLTVTLSKDVTLKDGELVFKSPGLTEVNLTRESLDLKIVLEGTAYQEPEALSVTLWFWDENRTDYDLVGQIGTVLDPKPGPWAARVNCVDHFTVKKPGLYVLEVEFRRQRYPLQFTVRFQNTLASRAPWRLGGVFGAL